MAAPALQLSLFQKPAFSLGTLLILLFSLAQTAVFFHLSNYFQVFLRSKIVEGCTDADIMPKPPWRERKQRYIAKFRHATPEVRRVSLADKLHNARSIEADYRKIGEAIWERFQGRKEGTLWFYRALIEAAQEAGDSSFLLSELERVVTHLEFPVIGKPS